MTRRAGRSLGGRQTCLSQDSVQAVIYLSTEGFRAPAPNRKLFPPCCTESNPVHSPGFPCVKTILWLTGPKPRPGVRPSACVILNSQNTLAWSGDHFCFRDKHLISVRRRAQSRLEPGSIIVLHPGVLGLLKMSGQDLWERQPVGPDLDLKLYDRSWGLSCLASPAVGLGMRPAGHSRKTALPPAGGILRVATALLVQLGYRGGEQASRRCPSFGPHCLLIYMSFACSTQCVVGHGLRPLPSF